MNIIELAKEAGGFEVDGKTAFYSEELERFAALVAANERETHRLPKLTDEQIWQCNSDGSGGYHICVDHQNVVDFARSIEREIGFDRANLWLKRIRDEIRAEREACAKVCEERGFDPYTGLQFAAAIRARREK
jgi:hypothetical protein